MRLAVAVGILLAGFVGFRAADFYVETYDAAFAGWRDGYERVDDMGGFVVFARKPAGG